jgi:hypothetical protein
MSFHVIRHERRQERTGSDGFDPSDFMLNNERVHIALEVIVDQGGWNFVILFFPRRQTRTAFATQRDLARLAQCVLVVIASLTPTHIFRTAERYLVALSILDPSLPFPRCQHEAMLRTLSRTRNTLSRSLLRRRRTRPRHVPLYESIKVKILDPFRI